MRTTIEISDFHRARLVKLAAERGEKGFSHLIAQAIDAYLTALGLGDDRLEARKLRGVLSGPEADELEERARAIRATWR